MNEEDLKKINNIYSTRFEKYGVKINTITSGKEEDRQIRFNNLYEVGIKNGDSILDLGCGLGDLYFFLEKKLGKKNFTYTGIDINPVLLGEAKKRIPEGQFIEADITENKIEHKFDFVVSSGCFNHKLEHEDNYSYIEKIIKSSYDLSKKGTAIELMTSYVDFKLDSAFYYEPEKIFSICKKITKRVTLRHDYPMYDFVMYLYPDFLGWGKKTF